MKVLITGGSRGIGAAVVDIYTEHGYDVDAPTRQEMDLLEKESILAYVERKSGDGGYDIIINNAGCNYIYEMGELDSDRVNEMIQTNLMAPVQILNGFVPGMKKKGFGRIVNIGSIWGCIAKPGRSIYSSTKHGIHGITMTLAVELAQYDILINTVAPGQTNTELTRKNNSPEDIEKMNAVIPLGRLAEPLEIAKVVFALGTENNTYITGQQIVVDGGLTIR